MGKGGSGRQIKATRPEGLEPSTYGLEIRCSVQLSYGRKCSAFNDSNLDYGG